MSRRCRYCLPDQEWPGCDLWFCKLAKLYVWPGQECMAAPRVRSGDGTCFGTGDGSGRGDCEAHSASEGPVVTPGWQMALFLVEWAYQWGRERGVLPPL